ncbi:MAG: hypothetical protein COA36_13885 [Desulfotalea sp.]|nr:MAG: hypothetical protein COA36_13885 [Desulfotalea sp.]
MLDTSLNPFLEKMQNQQQSFPQISSRESTEKPLLRSLFYPSVILTFFIIIIHTYTPLGIVINQKALDFLLNVTTVETTQSETITISIDDNSLKQYGQWPWSRYRLAKLLEKIQEGGSKIIAINILFPEMDRTSPSHRPRSLAHELANAIETSTVPEILTDHDIYLAKTFATGNYVLGYEFLFQQTDDLELKCRPQPISLQFTNTDQPPHPLSLYTANNILCNNPTLLTSHTASGFFNGTPDKDGIFRRLPLLLEFEGKAYPSFALEIFLRLKESHALSLTMGKLGTRYITPGNFPIDRKGNVIISGYSDSHGTTISAADVFNDDFDPAIFKDKIVFVGITASGIAQEYQLTNGDSISMVDIHKLAYQSLTATRHSVRGDLFWVIETILSFFLASLFALCIARFSTPWICAILLATLGLLGISSVFSAWQLGLLFSPLLACNCLLLNFFFLLTLKYKYFQKRSATEAGSALELLESSQENLQSILNTIPDIIFRLDKNGKIIFISSAIAKYKRLQWPVLGSSIFSLVIPEDREKAQFKLNERRTGIRATYDFEVRLRLTLDTPHRTGEVRYFSVSAAGLYKKDKSGSSTFTGTQGIVKDITQRKQIEDQLLQAKKMETMGNLAAGVAHDLNNILSGLVSYPDMILADLAEDDPLYKKISLIKKSGEKAAIIVQDLLTLTGRNVHPQEVSNLNTIISDYLESTEHNQAMQQQPFVSIETKLAEPHVNIKCSPVHISKTVMNLVNNAMEAMPTGGKIVISTAKVSIQQVVKGYEDIPAGDYALLSIQDNGIGIPTSDIPRIFEPFYTKKPTHKQGTGLGMAIIWATIKDHYGYLDISSSHEQGTVISIYLPATTEQIIGHKNKSNHYKGRETVLILDDLEEQLTIAGNMLHHLGYKVITVQNGTEALSILAKSAVDLVMLDMIMPGQMSGLETYKKILQIHPYQKAIISSGYSESDDVRTTQKLGAGGYIQKPYTMEELGHAVRTELDR